MRHGEIRRLAVALRDGRASLAGHPEQVLGHRETQQLGVAERRLASPAMLT